MLKYKYIKLMGVIMENSKYSISSQIDDEAVFEFEEETDDSESLLNDFERMSRIGSDWNVVTIIDMIKRKKINLNPSFQRRDAWSTKQKSRFIESLIIGVPVPSILLGEDINDKGKLHVIDGKQRLLSILQFFEGKLKRSYEDDEIKGYRLRGMDILSNLNGFSVTDLYDANNENSYFDILQMASMRTVVIKNITTEDVLYEVFRRLNTGSQKLSTQELRQSLFPGPFVDYIDDITSENNLIRYLLRNANKDNRMRDNELFLRYFAIKFLRNNYDNRLNSFLNDSTKYLNNKFDEMFDEIENARYELDKAIEFTLDTMGEQDAFRLIGLGRKNLPFNRVVFELFTYYFSFPLLRKKIFDEKINLKEKYLDLQKNQNFVISITENTHQTNRLNDRFNIFSDFLFQITGIRVV